MFETIRTARDLKSKLAERLNLWAATAVVPKIPRYVDLLPTSGKDVLKSASLRLRGEKLVELGQPEFGRAALEEAAAIGGPDEHLALAAFLRHDGELDRALEQTQQAIDFYSAADDTLHSVAAADAFSAQARVLSAQGKKYDAIGRLEQALSLLLQDDLASEAVRCRILDDLGLAHQHLGDLRSARQNFEESLQRRRKRLTARDVAQLINLARLEVAEESLDAAVELANQVIETLLSSPTTALHGNANALVAQLRLRQGRPAEGIPNGKAALAANRQIGNKPDEAISLLVLGQCCRAAGLLDEARSYLLDCVKVNESMGNAAGVEKATWQLDRLNDDDA
ncbi:tetratricopeptide repeat protein [Gordonia sp. L191]|uniref:tetratricopeptide repeat protein n=1 Tax=Gordonia sp. L191 TaxID=2982699 RepID=UPI0024BFF56B|nr:tetratricopeptide repeat protein [Gordonia sp. L191]WHU47075.1 tetratricopeptide repeat protein [Gordonia sp. L191]